MMGLDDRSTENKELGESNEPDEVENNTQGELTFAILRDRVLTRLIPV